MVTKIMNEMRRRMFLQQYLKNAEKKSQRIYASYVIRKLNGEELSFEALCKVELETLIKIENISNKQIAFLFDTNNETVQIKRKQWGIKKEFNGEFAFVS